ncbi:hypothetical protein N665_0538s0023 [Sinapis alba]|nr:hypothetical protein N665_0538s0023 [Sinapis alba]
MSGQENHDGGRISTPSASERKAPHSSDYAFYPKFDPNDVTPRPPAPISGAAITTMPPEFNPYVSPSPVPKKVATIGGRCEPLRRSVSSRREGRSCMGFHCPGILRQVYSWNHRKIFKQTFECLPDEQLRKTYACYLSTFAGHVMGVMYLSTQKLAFCSDSPLSYKEGDQTKWSHYKVR